ncbi:hypothetical protein KC906_02620 [Candidatus Kaiserbacteria bacterium]|nr:hypothetical protein [Candidatus Kaiserbacteria bacterium]
MDNHNNSQSKRLKEVVFDRIEHEKVCPHSRWFFHSRECIVWFFWFLSVLVGALAVAVSLFVVVHGQYALYEATHDNFITFLVDALPYLWISIFGLMVFVAVYNLRHTKHGYRHPLWMIMASSIVLSFAGGSALQFFGFGYTIDDILGERMALYVSQKKFEQQLWQDPDDGRLLGRQVYSTLAPTSTVVFEDFGGRRWSLNVSELHPRDRELLATQQTVRLLGKVTAPKLALFHACVVHPWMIDAKVTAKDMSLEREVFIERVYDHASKEARLLIPDVSPVFASSSLSHESVCASLAVVRRMPVVAEDR